MCCWQDRFRVIFVGDAPQKFGSLQRDELIGVDAVIDSKFVIESGEVLGAVDSLLVDSGYVLRIAASFIRLKGRLVFQF